MELIGADMVSLEEIADDLRGCPEPRDHSGYHVTDLYWEAQRIARGKAKPDYKGLEGLAEMGKIWEYTVMKNIQKKFHNPPQTCVLHGPTFEFEGVKGSMDGLIVDMNPTETVVVECKYKIGQILKPDDRPDWMWQTKSYCKMVGARTVLMPILFVQSRPPKYIPIYYTFSFTDIEVEENWSTLINTMNYVMREEIEQRERRERGEY